MVEQPKRHELIVNVTNEDGFIVARLTGKDGGKREIARMLSTGQRSDLDIFIQMVTAIVNRLVEAAGSKVADVVVQDVRQ